jgi:hypothetical protein
MEWAIVYMVGGFLTAALCICARRLGAGKTELSLLGFFIIFLAWPFFLLGYVMSFAVVTIIWSKTRGWFPDWRK